MSDSKALRGIFCPLTTPFNHAGALYPAKIRHNVARLERTTLAGYWVGDEAGEGARLTTAERRELLGLTAEAAGESKTLAAAVSAESVAESTELADAARAAGYQFAVARSVRDAGPAERAQALQLLYFRTLADRSSLPLIVVSGGARALPVESLLRLAEHPNVAAVCLDDAEPDALAALLGAGVTALCGSERQMAGAARRGAGILPLANVIPFYLLCLEEALRTREDAAADELAARASGAFERLYAELGAAGLKRGVDLRGGYGGAPRLPEAPLPPSAATAVERLLDGLAS